MKRLKIKADKLFFTSDTHFGHENIMKFTTRKFDTIEDMNDYIIERWNEVVPEDGVVIHCGDVSWRGKEYTEGIIKKLNGKIILIQGNHDNIKICTIFDEYYDMVKIDALNDNNERIQIHACHYPFEEWDGSNKGVIHIHGHQHNSKETRIRTENKIDVGLDGNDLKVYPFTEIIELLNLNYK